MAGDVNKLRAPRRSGGHDRRNESALGRRTRRERRSGEILRRIPPLHPAAPTTIHDQETKQVEFVSATGIRSQRLYVYDGAQIAQYGYYNPEQIRQDPSYGTQSNPKVFVMQEFKNSEANHLGIALPKGRLRFYRRDTDGHLEFIGENSIDHTPKDETLRLYTGNAFDIVGERKRTNYHVENSQHWMDESFEIRVRNHKKTRRTSA